MTKDRVNLCLFNQHGVKLKICLVPIPKNEKSEITCSKRKATEASKEQESGLTRI